MAEKFCKVIGVDYINFTKSYGRGFDCIEESIDTLEFEGEEQIFITDEKFEEIEERVKNNTCDIRQDASMILIIEEEGGYKTRTTRVGVYLSNKDNKDNLFEDKLMSEYLTKYLDWHDKSLNHEKKLFIKKSYETFKKEKENEKA